MCLVQRDLLAEFGARGVLPCFVCASDAPVFVYVFFDLTVLAEAVYKAFIAGSAAGGVLASRDGGGVAGNVG